MKGEECDCFIDVHGGQLLKDVPPFRVVREIGRGRHQRTSSQETTLKRSNAAPIILKALLILTNQRHFLPHNGEIHRMLGPSWLLWL